MTDLAPIPHLPNRSDARPKPAPVKGNAGGASWGTSRGASGAAYQLACRAVGVLVAAYVQVIVSVLPDMDQALRTARRLHHYVRRIGRIAQSLRQKERRAALRDNPALRWQVRRDLGGVMAMTRWAVRKRQAEALVAAKHRGRQATTPSRTNGPAVSHSPHPSSAKRWQAKTDRAGDYRLAVIPTGPRTHPQSIDRHCPGHSGDDRWANLLRWRPLEVTPADLATPMEPTGTGGATQSGRAAQRLSLPTGYAPTVERWPKNDAG